MSLLLLEVNKMTLSSKARLRRRKTRLERKRHNITCCTKCKEPLTSNDLHHTMHNKCWNECHPNEHWQQRKLCL